MSKHNYQIKDRLLWYIKRPNTPKPAWRYPTDGWITDPQEIIKAIRLDDELGIKMTKDNQELREDLWADVPLKVALRDAVASAMTGYKYLEVKDDETLDATEEYEEIDKLVNLLAHMFIYYKSHL